MRCRRKDRANSHRLLALTAAAQTILTTGLNYALNSVLIIQVSAAAAAGGSWLTLQQLLGTLPFTFLGSVLGSAAGAVLTPPLGARYVLLLICPVNVLGALAAALGRSYQWLLVGRMVVFFTMALGEGTARGFIAELSPPRRRALYTTLTNNHLFVGQIAALLLGSVMPWTSVVIIAAAVPAAICMAGMLIVHNSPKWVLARGRSELEARNALFFYHGADSDIDGEIGDIQESLRQLSAGGEDAPLWRLALRRETLHPLALAAVQMVLFAWTGGSTLILITALVFEPLQLPWSKYQLALLPPAVSVVASVASAPLLERVGRLPLLRLGGALSAVGCAAVAIYFLSPALRDSGWVVLVGAALLQLAFSGVFAPISFGLAVEMLPNKTRALGANVAIGVLYVSATILMQAYPHMEATIGHGGAFLLHAGLSLFQVLFATCCLYETAGLSLEQVQQLFQRNKEDN